MTEIEADRVSAMDTFGVHAGWLDLHWRTRPRSWFLWLATGHNYQHLGEAITVRTLCGATWPA